MNSDVCKNPFKKTVFLKSAALITQLPKDIGFEVAFAGRSNAGKSSALNYLTGIRQLARTSKTPGRTQLINVFTVGSEEHRLIDLPGYGYAKAAISTKEQWQKVLSQYLETRNSLKGLILLTDCRHPLKPLDRHMLEWAINGNLPTHILLSKSDKISHGALKNTISKIQTEYKPYMENILSIQGFSSTKKQGLENLINVLEGWLNI